MNPVLVLTHNNLTLTKRCVDAIRKQDIPTDLFIFDNGSTDGSPEWIDSLGVPGMLHPENKGVSYGWNLGLEFCFEDGAEQVLAIGNDTVIPPGFYRTLLESNKHFYIPFLTGVAVDNMEQALQTPIIEYLTPRPDFSAFVITRDAWDKIGRFDERMVHYCSDCDYHVRGHRLGVPMMKAAIPFYHERSSTLRLASPEDRLEIETQANKDRQMFHSIYGCLPGSKEYEAIFL